ncbi:hypothetical protein B0I35DRAFT_209165 [Stachybotrys elegans]|uniref:Uncharacterized protein n=1 Tax=Stachybotrys elegans TaxID=80388 RepID=A0A8K0SZT9_9HYPO|nr:hypothetical protein B0I35DRAFT_209165 [Stachybotrys elegans]
MHALSCYSTQRVPAALASVVPARHVHVGYTDWSRGGRWRCVCLQDYLTKGVRLHMVIAHVIVSETPWLPSHRLEAHMSQQRETEGKFLDSPLGTSFTIIAAGGGKIMFVVVRIDLVSIAPGAPDALPLPLGYFSSLFSLVSLVFLFGNAPLPPDDIRICMCGLAHGNVLAEESYCME